LNNLAELYRSQGRFNDAEPLYQRALAIFERTLGLDDPDITPALNNLSSVYGNQSRAEPFYQRPFAIGGKVLGPDHLDIADSLNNLAE